MSTVGAPFAQDLQVALHGRMDEVHHNYFTDKTIDYLATCRIVDTSRRYRSDVFYASMLGCGLIDRDFWLRDRIGVI